MSRLDSSFFSFYQEQFGNVFPYTEHMGSVSKDEFSRWLATINARNPVLVSQTEASTYVNSFNSRGDIARNIFTKYGQQNQTVRQAVMDLFNAGFLSAAQGIARLADANFTLPAPNAAAYTAPAAASLSQATDPMDGVVRRVKKVVLDKYVIAASLASKVQLVKTAEPLLKKADATEFLEAVLESPKYKDTICSYYIKADGAVKKGSKTKLVSHAEEINSDSDDEIQTRTTQIHIKESSLKKGSTKANVEEFEVDGQLVKIATGGALPTFLIVMRTPEGVYRCVNFDGLEDYDVAKQKLKLVKSQYPANESAIYIRGTGNEQKEDDIEVEDNAVITIGRPSSSSKAKSKPVPKGKAKAKPAKKPVSDDEEEIPENVEEDESEPAPPPVKTYSKAKGAASKPIAIKSSAVKPAAAKPVAPTKTAAPTPTADEDVEEMIDEDD